VPGIGAIQQRQRAIKLAALLRGKQDEKSASIRMRKCRRMRDEGRV
jgi:hypothetical protein